MIITAGALGVALCVAFLAVDKRDDPVPASAEFELPAVTGSKPTAGGDAEPVPDRAESVGAPDAEPVADQDWSECADAIRDNPPSALDGLGDGRTPPIVQILSNSGSAEHVLAGALLRPQNDRGAIQADIERALALDGDHPLVLWHADGWCGRGFDAPFCGTAAFASRISEFLETNGALWMRRAVHSAEQGNERQSLEAVYRAAVAPDYVSYWGQHLVLFEHALAAGGGQSAAQRIATAAGLTMAVHAPRYRLFDICRELSVEDSMWMDACINLAARVSADSETYLDKAVSYQLLEDLYRRNGREQAARAAARSLAELKGLLAIEMSEATPFLVDDRLASRWLDELVANGEIAAMKFAAAEIGRLKADPDYDPCALIIR